MEERGMRVAKQLLRICPICNNSKGEILHSMNFSLLENAILPSQFDVVAYTNCGFVFNDSSAVQEDYNRYYSRNSIYESTNLKGLGGSNDNNRIKNMKLKCSYYAV
jgi:hypothetical protein